MREQELLQHIYAANAGLPGGVIIRPGDDMGAVRIGGTDVLVTVDQVAEGVHFSLAEMPLAKIGRKAITRNLSDVAAMAAVPAGAVAAASLPRGFGEQNAQKLFDAMRATAAQYQCPLFGGDISIWNGPLIVTVTILAEAKGISPVLRAGAQAGDGIYVTGQLGGSLETVNGYTHHLDFEPRLTVARKLAERLGKNLHAMIDLSDGLAKDLGHLCQGAEKGKLGAEILETNLPLSAGAKQAAAKDGRATWQHAVGDGEDYELCLTVAGDIPVPKEIDGVPVTRIGTMREWSGQGERIQVRLADGGLAGVANLGWEHRGS
ncbi:MAG: thiamine-phosphate kinase [Phycisphaeraceae bacterium]|nr:thiamine-phosphate kinase [Phycisphaeraceae bacterium]